MKWKRQLSRVLQLETLVTEPELKVMALLIEFYDVGVFEPAAALLLRADVRTNSIASKVSFRENFHVSFV